MKRFAELLDENKEHLAHVMAKDTGKPLWETRTEVAAMVGKELRFLSGAYHEAKQARSRNDMPGAKAFIRHKPHGVVAVFRAYYNFPGHLPNGHIVPALLRVTSLFSSPVN